MILVKQTGYSINRNDPMWDPLYCLYLIICIYLLLLFTSPTEKDKKLNT